MNTIQYAPLEASHTNGLCELWNRELGAEFPLTPRLVRQNSFGPTACLAEASWAALDADTGAIAGVVIGKLIGPGEAGTSGSICLLLVDSAFRRQGIGGRLLELAEQALRSAGAGSLVTGRELGHYLPGVPTRCYELKRWLERRGYWLGETVYDVFADFAGQPPTAMPAQAGLTCRLLDPQADGERFLVFLRQHFASRWAESAAACLDAGSDGREFILLFLEEELVGFCRINDESAPLLAANVYWNGVFPPGTSGGIGPLGVAAEYRGHGYGLAAVQAGIAFLRARGHDAIVIDWTTHLDFYAKWGFQTWKSYDCYRKP